MHHGMKASEVATQLDHDYVCEVSQIFQNLPFGVHLKINVNADFILPRRLMILKTRPDRH